MNNFMGSTSFQNSVYAVLPELMVEQSHAGEGHGHAVLVALGDDQIVPDGAAGLGDILHAAAVRPLDVVREREEGVASQGHALPGVQPGPGLGGGEVLRLAGEILLPVALGADVLLIAVDVAVDELSRSGRARGQKGRSNT